MKRSRTVAGFFSVVLGMGLLAGAVHTLSEPSRTGPTTTVVATASAVSGGVLTFVVARRLLSSPATDDRKRG